MLFLGVMDYTSWVKRKSPRCLARTLGGDAWMVGSYGYVCTTTKEGQVPLTEDAKRQIGDAGVGSLAFGQGTLVRMTLKRSEGTLSVQIGAQKPFVIKGVSKNARPFVNLSREGDCVSLCRAGEEAVQVPVVEGFDKAGDEVVGGRQVSHEEMRRIREAADSFWK